MDAFVNPNEDWNKLLTIFWRNLECNFWRNSRRKFSSNLGKNIRIDPWISGKHPWSNAWWNSEKILTKYPKDEFSKIFWKIFLKVFFLNYRFFRNLWKNFWKKVKKNFWQNSRSIFWRNHLIGWEDSKRIFGKIFEIQQRPRTLYGMLARYFSVIFAWFLQVIPTGI